jgi:hypothetical protein
MVRSAAHSFSTSASSAILWFNTSVRVLFCFDFSQVKYCQIIREICSLATNTGHLKQEGRVSRAERCSSRGPDLYLANTEVTWRDFIFQNQVSLAAFTYRNIYCTCRWTKGLESLPVLLNMCLPCRWRIFDAGRQGKRNQLTSKFTITLHCSWNPWSCCVSICCSGFLIILFVGELLAYSEAVPCGAGASRPAPGCARLSSQRNAKEEMHWTTENWKSEMAPCNEMFLEINSVGRR